MTAVVGVGLQAVYVSRFEGAEKYNCGLSLSLGQKSWHHVITKFIFLDAETESNS
jgi:hypothetical protein